MCGNVIMLYDFFYLTQNLDLERFVYYNYFEK